MIRVDKTLKDFRDQWFAFLNWRPHDAQKRLLSLYDTNRFLVCVNGRRWGKSETVAKIAEVELLQPNKSIALVGPTYRDCTRLFKLVWNDFVIAGKYKPAEGSSFSKNILVTEWGTELTTISTDSITSGTSSKGLGDSYTLMILDEAAKMHPSAWSDYLRPSLSDQRGKAVFITTPWGYNWVYDLYLLGQDDETDTWGSMQSPTWENTEVFEGYEDEEIQEYLRNNSKESFDQNFGALFTTTAGRVFSEFKRETHVKELKYEKGWNTYVSIDWGFRHPSVGVFQTGVVNGAPQVRLINEIAGENLTDEQLLLKIRTMIKDNDYNINGFVGDSAGSGVQSGTGIGPIEYFRRKGIIVQYKTDKLSKNIAGGVDHVRKFIRNANGDIGFYVDPRCKEAIKSLEGYVYPEGRGGRAVKEEPLKDDVHDHFPDLIRYFMVWKYPLKATYAIGYAPRG